MNNNITKVQPVLNLDGLGVNFPELELEKLRKHLQLFKEEKISTRNLLDRAKAGKFEDSCSLGRLTIKPSHKGEFLWDLILYPVAFIPYSG